MRPETVGDPSPEQYLGNPRVGVTLVDEKGRTMLLNRAAARLLELDENLSLGAPLPSQASRAGLVSDHSPPLEVATEALLGTPGVVLLKFRDASSVVAARGAVAKVAEECAASLEDLRASARNEALLEALLESARDTKAGFSVVAARLLRQVFPAGGSLRLPGQPPIDWGEPTSPRFEVETGSAGILELAEPWSRLAAEAFAKIVAVASQADA